MEEFLTEMAEILDEDSVDAGDELAKFESWDSLAALSVAALADANFGVNMPAQEIKEATTVGNLYERIVAKTAA